MNSYLRVYESHTGKKIAEEKIAHAWITHVSFCPKDKEKILYNHEWASYDYGIRRMWIWDGMKHIMLRESKKEKGKDDFVCHEVWDDKGESIIYHGRYSNETTFLGRVSSDGSEITEIEIPKLYQREGHVIPCDERLLVTDGFFDRSDLLWKIKNKMKSILRGKEAHFCGKFITLMKVNWKEKKIQWMPLCEHGSDWRSQDSHPHPIFNRAKNEVYFNSNRTGRSAIYKVDISRRI
jgi:hypothetical protein